MTDPALASAVQSRLDGLLATGKVWLKLSAPYLASATADGFDDLRQFVESILRRHADRLVWGTDWPHVTEADKPDDVALLDTLATWIPGEALQTQVMVDNASRLYGF